MEEMHFVHKLQSTDESSGVVKRENDVEKAFTSNFPTSTILLSVAHRTACCSIGSKNTKLSIPESVQKNGKCSLDFIAQYFVTKTIMNCVQCIFISEFSTQTTFV
jgi:hypothetical protein